VCLLCRQAEEDRQRREEEEEARQEVEELRLAQEGAAAERERFLKLVEGEEKRKQEEAERIVIEKQEVSDVDKCREARG